MIHFEGTRWTKMDIVLSFFFLSQSHSPDKNTLWTAWIIGVYINVWKLFSQGNMEGEPRECVFC